MLKKQQNSLVLHKRMLTSNFLLVECIKESPADLSFNLFSLLDFFTFFVFYPGLVIFVTLINSAKLGLGPIQSFASLYGLCPPHIVLIISK